MFPSVTLSLGSSFSSSPFLSAVPFFPIHSPHTFPLSVSPSPLAPVCSRAKSATICHHLTCPFPPHLYHMGTASSTHFFDSSSRFSCRRTEHSCPSKSCEIPARVQAHPFLPTFKIFPVLSFLPIFHQLFLVSRLTSQLGASSLIDRGLV